MVIIYETHSLVNIQTVNMSTPKKRKVLTLEERVQAVKFLKSGKSARSVAEEMGVGRTQIQLINKRKAEIMSDYDANENPAKKRQCRKTGNEEINKLVFDWFCVARSQRIVITGPLLKEKALKFASDLGIDFLFCFNLSIFFSMCVS